MKRTVVVCLAVWLVISAAPVAAQHQEQQVAELLKGGQFERARAALEPLLRARPGDPALMTLDGMALRGLGRNQDSKALFRAVLLQRPDYLAALQGLAQVEYATGDENTTATLGKILELQPNNPTAHAMLAVLAAEKNDCAQAAVHFDRAQQAFSDNPSALWQQAACLFEADRLAEAEKAYRRVLELSPEHPRAKFNLALTLFRLENYDAAIELLAPMAQAADADADLLSLLADVYEDANQTPQAVETLQRAVKRYPSEEQIYLQLAELCVAHGSYDLADDVLTAGIKTLGPSARLYTMRGVVHAQQGRFDQSEEAFEQAARLNANNEITAMGLTLTLQEDGRLDQAIEVLRQQLLKSPQHAELNYMLSQALVKQGTEPGQPAFAEAVSALQRSIESNPENARSRAALGQLYLKSGETQEAIRQLERALEINPSDRTASYQLMLALRKAGRNQEAAELVEKVRRMVDDDRQSEVLKNRYRLVRTDGPGRP